MISLSGRVAFIRIWSMIGWQFNSFAFISVEKIGLLLRTTFPSLLSTVACPSSSSYSNNVFLTARLGWMSMRQKGQLPMFLLTRRSRHCLQALCWLAQIIIGYFSRRLKVRLHDSHSIFSRLILRANPGGRLSQHPMNTYVNEIHSLGQSFTKMKQ